MGGWSFAGRASWPFAGADVSSAMTFDTHDARALEALLDFYVEAGIDFALDEEPHDRFADTAAEMAARAEQRARMADDDRTTAPERTPQSRAEPPRGAAIAAFPQGAETADEAALSARGEARAARTMEELRERLAAFEACALRRTAKSLVFADGNPAARVMLVGEAPGRDEDIQGLPFVGRSGQLLDRMLAAIGLDRTSVYIANIVPWRPPGNRTPTPQEAAICRPFIERQIELCDPDILVCLGGPSAQALLDIKEGILRSRGKWVEYHTGTRTIRALATLHPAYLLRQPLQKKLAWRDLRALRKTLDSLAPRDKSPS
ncbi:DNA polymerase [Chelatococcus asaccharovorans]|uniref:Type-4 uracil-DNA glycosylase n=2 Tax=Chelatococcus asaccharovorans TaxID=28210 RepID=A0A2V3U353_9HYPH|nr:DNA polymerase [Chelatococcus asaccharovorans]